jgi:hypothetical protein
VIFLRGNTSLSHFGDAPAAGERLRAQKSVKGFSQVISTVQINPMIQGIAKQMINKPAERAEGNGLGLREKTG